MAQVKTILSAGVLVVASAFITSQVMSGPEKTMDKGAPQTSDKSHGQMGSPEEQEMMKKWMEFSTPSATHEKLKQLEGKWDLKVTSWMTEGAPPTTSTATSHAKLAMGGRYLIERVEGEGMDWGDGNKMPFEGMAVCGYNNGTKEMFSFWIDNMGTGYMLDTGKMSADGKTIDSGGSMYCPMREKMCESKSKVTVVDANTRKMEMWAPDMATEKMYKCMEIVYTRAK